VSSAHLPWRVRFNEKVEVRRSVAHGHGSGIIERLTETAGAEEIKSQSSRSTRFGEVQSQYMRDTRKVC
jgi:hypothetical protein